MINSHVKLRGPSGMGNQVIIKSMKLRGTTWNAEPSHSITHETEGTAWSAEPSHVVPREDEPFWEIDLPEMGPPTADRRPPTVGGPIRIES